MNKKPGMPFVVSHLMELTGLFHGLFRGGLGKRRENKTNMIRYYILKCLSQRGSVTLTTISGVLRLKKNTLSELFDRMVKDGLISRAADADDRRKTILSLRAKGDAAIAEFENFFQQNLDQFLIRLSTGERREFLGSLETIIRISRAHRREIITNFHDKLCIAEEDK